MNKFWENQSLNQKSFIHSISNLSNNKKFSQEKSITEKKKIEHLLNSTKRYYKSCLEIGAGTCQWTQSLLKISESVLVTDTCKGMLDIGQEFLKKKKFKNKIDFFVGDICDEKSPQNSPYDLVFISGLILYLNRSEFSKLTKFISMNTKTSSTLVIREPVGINKEYILDNVYSEELKTNYSAHYRTEKNIIDAFKINNFFVETNDWLHPENSKFNKWKETRLKLISLRRK